MRQRSILLVVDSVDELREMGPLWILADQLSSVGYSFHLTSLTPITEIQKSRYPIFEYHEISFDGYQSFTAQRLRSLIRQLQPQAVHCWSRNLPLAVLVAVASTHSLRLIWTCFQKPEFQGNTMRWLQRRFLTRNLRCVVTHPSLQVDVNEFARPKLVQTISNAALPDIRVSSGIREKLLRLASCPSDSILVGTVAELTPRFRLKDLVWAIDLLCCVRNDVHLIVFARDSNANLERFIGQTEAGENIHIVDMKEIDAADLAGLDLYWNAQTVEPQPFCMQVAMSRRIPCVSPWVAETDELVIPMATAFATNYGARDEFARWTKYYCEQNDAAEKLASQGRRFVQKKYPAEKMVAAYEKIYSMD